jgi:hypothetical protein
LNAVSTKYIVKYDHSFLFRIAQGTKESTALVTHMQMTKNEILAEAES